MKEYFCLADGRTAALINAESGCDFWCWPYFDSPLRLAALLDPHGGGSVGVTIPPGLSTSAAWSGASRVILFSGPDGLRVQCGLLEDGAGNSAIAWLVDAPTGRPVQISFADPKSGGGGGWVLSRFGAVLEKSPLEDGPGGPLALVVTGPTQVGVGALVAEVPADGLVVWLGAPCERGRLPPLLALASEAPAEAVQRTRELLAESVTDDRRWLAQLHRGTAMASLVQQGPPWAVAAVDRSLLTLRGLQDRDSGLLVAAPTTSIPQWPSSERAWDYRYAWLRDCADAGIALCHAGALPEAEAVARGLGGRVGERPDQLAPVRRLLGGQLPPEHIVGQLRGYSGALVRVGNSAAGQAQLDTIGEVARLAGELDRVQACPDELLRHLPALAEAAARRWQLADHGIWEVRGDPQDYVHSKVMAWAALQVASSLAERGRIEGPITHWREESAAITRTVRNRGQGPDGELVMSFQDSGADSSLLAAYLTLFVTPDRPGAEVTLGRIARDLGRWPLMARHSPERDGLDSPCFPFIFPGLWAVNAEAMLGRSEAAEARLLAICQLAGPSGQLSEVADPESGALWGNYPQVQSHAALVDAALALWPPRSRSRQ